MITSRSCVLEEVNNVQYFNICSVDVDHALPARADSPEPTQYLEIDLELNFQKFLEIVILVPG